MRRVSIFAAVLAIAGAFLQPAMASDFTQYQSNVRHDGRVQEPGLGPPFARAWSLKMDAPGYPVIAGGTVFVIDRHGSTSGTKVRAVDLATGTLLWKKAIPGSYNWATLTYDAGRLFVLSDASILYAFDAATGDKVWTADLGYIIFSPPTAADGVVYVDANQFLFALSEADGSTLWTAPVTDGDFSGPTLSATRVFVQNACTLTQALRRSDGVELWRYTTGCSGGGGATAVLHDGLLYTRDSGDNRILDAKTGSFVDAYAASAIPAFDSKTMFSLVGKRLEAIDLATGNVRWGRAYDKGFVSNPLVVDHWVIEGSSTGQVVAYRKGTGRLVWHAPVPPVAPTVEGQLLSPQTGLAAGNGYLIVPTTTRLVAFRSAGV